VSGQLHDLAVLCARKELRGTHWMGGWVGPKAGLHGVAKRINPFPFRESNSGRPARSLV